MFLDATAGVGTVLCMTVANAGCRSGGRVNSVKLCPAGSDPFGVANGVSGALALGCSTKGFWD